MYQICKQCSYVMDSLFDLADETELGKNGGGEVHFTFKEPLFSIMNYLGALKNDGAHR